MSATMKNSCLFKALLRPEQVAADIAYDSPARAAHARALEFLALDSDEVVIQVETKGSHVCSDTIRSTNLAIEYWSHQITIMQLAVGRAQLIQKFAEGRKDSETVN